MTAIGNQTCGKVFAHSIAYTDSMFYWHVGFASFHFYLVCNYQTTSKSSKCLFYFCSKWNQKLQREQWRSWILRSILQLTRTELDQKQEVSFRTQLPKEICYNSYYYFIFVVVGVSGLSFVCLMRVWHFTYTCDLTV